MGIDGGLLREVAYLNHNRHAGDNGGVVGYDNAHDSGPLATPWCVPRMKIKHQPALGVDLKKAIQHGVSSKSYCCCMGKTQNSRSPGSTRIGSVSYRDFAAW